MDPEIASRKIFIGGLSYGTDDEKLRQYFEAFGAVQDAVVMKDPVSRRSRGFGFITFEHTSFVDNVLERDVHVIDSRKVEAKRAVPRSEVSREPPSGSKTSASPVTPSSPVAHSHSRTSSISSNHSHNSGGGSNNNTKSNSMNAVNPNKSPAAGRHTRSPVVSASSSSSNSASGATDDYAFCKIFVGGLHYDTRDGEFRKYFEKYGKVLSAEVMFNRETHKSRGFGFIVFEQEGGVDRVCTENEHSIDGKVVEVKRAVPRSKITPSSTPTSGHKSTPPSPLPSASPRATHKGKSNAVPRKVVSSSSGSYAAALKTGGSASVAPVSPTSSLSNVSPSFVPQTQHSPRPHSLSVSSEQDGGGSVHSVHSSIGHSPVSHQPLPPMLPLVMQQQGFHSGLLPQSQYQMQQQQYDQLQTRPLRAHSESFISSSLHGQGQTGQYFENGHSVGASFQQQQQFLQQQHEFQQFQQHQQQMHQQQQHQHVQQQQQQQEQQQQQQQQQQFQQQQQQMSFDSLPPSGFARNINWSARDRGDVERSASLGGWMPSSASTSYLAQNGRGGIAPEARGGELGLEFGLGLGLNRGLDKERGAECMTSAGLAVPSPSDWAALVDVAMDHTASHDNIESSDLDQQRFPSSFSSQSEGEMGSMLGSPDFSAHVHQEESFKDISIVDEANFLMQELRVQTSEFQPTRTASFSSESSSVFPLDANGGESSSGASCSVNGFLWSSESAQENDNM